MNEISYFCTYLAAQFAYLSLLVAVGYIVSKSLQRKIKIDRGEFGKQCRMWEGISIISVVVIFSGIVVALGELIKGEYFPCENTLILKLLFIPEMVIAFYIISCLVKIYREWKSEQLS